MPWPTRWRTIRSRIGRPATRSIGLGTVSVSGRETVALPAGHDDRPVGAGRRLEERVEEVEPDRASVVVDDRDGVDPAGPHQFQDVGPAWLRATDDEVAVQDRAAADRRASPRRRRARRRSPSVTTPTSAPASSTASAIPPRPGSIAAIASRIVPSAGTMQARPRSSADGRRASRTPMTAAPAGHVGDDDGAHPDGRACPTVTWSRTRRRGR